MPCVRTYQNVHVILALHPCTRTVPVHCSRLTFGTGTVLAKIHGCASCTSCTWKTTVHTCRVQYSDRYGDMYRVRGGRKGRHTGTTVHGDTCSCRFGGLNMVHVTSTTCTVTYCIDNNHRVRAPVNDRHRFCHTLVIVRSIVRTQA
jgi:hypothetical protein